MTEGFIIQNGVLEAYTLRGEVVRVPDEVRVIGKGAFKGCTSIEEVILPETVSSIMEDAFKGCRNLRKINFPSEFSHIGEYAFHRCHSLRSVELPVGVKSLGNCVFLYCDSLEYASIPGVTTLGKQVFLNDVNLERLEISSLLDVSCICDVFTGCGKVSQIRLSDGTTYNIESLVEVISSHFDVHSLVRAIAVDIYRMMEIRDSVLLRFLTNLKYLEVPDRITAIGKSCFFDKKGLMSVKLPETLTDIGSRAFRNCINLEKVEFANENVHISSDAFKNCTTLKYITLPDGSTYELKGLPDTTDESMPEIVRTIHSQILNNFLISGTTLMQYRGNEERVVVPDGITVIGEKAFAGNEVVDRVILPDSVKEIREEAFADCLLLQTVYIQEGLEYLGKSAFENCVKLLRVELPESLTKIEKSAFNRCRKLNEVVFGSDIKEIGDLAFYACNSLKNVHFPEKLLSIGDMAFYKCFSLKEITLPKSLCKLGNNVFTASGIKSATVLCDLKECGTDIFSQCNKLSKLTFNEGVKHIGDKFAFRCPFLKYVDLPSTMEYIGRNAFEDSIYIKDTVQKNVAGTIFVDGSRLSGDVIIHEGITAIAGGAFYSNTAITSVTFPKSLMRIGSRAFCGCTSLRSVTLPESVIEVEEGVFAYCTSLKKVVSEGRITHIRDNAFYGCTEITQVLAAQAVHIGKNAFNGCGKLYDININFLSIQADAFGNTGFLNKLRSVSPLVIISNIVVDGRCCSGDVIIPEGVMGISPYAFSGNENITGAVLPESIVMIGECAFGGCRNLKHINLPPSIKHIERKAFEKCVSLTGVTGYAQDIGEGAFSYCMNLKNVTLGGTLSFGKEAFCGCASLESCESSEVEYIGESCFSGCDSLGDFDFSNVKHIGVSAFYGCDYLKSIKLNADTCVAAHAFEDCGSLEELSLSHEGLKFGSYAFAGCTALKAIGSCGKRYSTLNYGVLFDKDFPGIVKSIYSSAISCFNIDENLSIFGYINKGRRVNIPEGIKTIQREVFKDAMNLEEINIPKSVKYIGERAFHSTGWLIKQRTVTPMVIVNNILIDAYSCMGDAVIPDNVKIVSGWAFANCYGLTGVIYESAGTVTEEYAFRNCINLKKVITADGKEYRLTGIRNRNDETLPKVVKKIFTDCLNCFKTDENNVLVECTGNINDLVFADGITAIGENVFKDSNLLTNITLSKDTVSIGKSAFEHCKWLASVRNAGSVKRIENYAFSGCYSLESLELSDNLEFIGMRAFEHCSSLKSIVIPEGITVIPEKAFYRCKRLEKVLMPSTLKTIGREAFAFCYELTEINFPEGLEMIDSRAFAWCSKLNDRYMPEGVSVKDDSFSFCSL